MYIKLHTTKTSHPYLVPLSRLSALLRKAPTLTGAYNTGYTTHFFAQIGLRHLCIAPDTLSEMPQARKIKNREE